jgi:hypothetical protein
MCEDSRRRRSEARRSTVLAPTHRDIVALVPDKIERKHDLLAAELQRYFGETCPALTARWEAAITGLAPKLLRELASRLQELDAATKAAERQLKFTLRPVAERGASTEPVLDQALASLEHLSEIAEAMLRRVDELLTGR